MISDEEIIFIIEEFVSRDAIPKWTFYSGIKTKLFRTKSLLRWAADYLENYILVHHGLRYEDILISFRERMSNFYLMSGKTKDEFQVAYKLANDIIEILSAAGWI